MTNASISSSVLCLIYSELLLLTANFLRPKTQSNRLGLPKMRFMAPAKWPWNYTHSCMRVEAEIRSSNNRGCSSVASWGYTDKLGKRQLNSAITWSVVVVLYIHELYLHTCLVFERAALVH